MRKKSKELLDNLNKIVEKPKSRFASEKIEVITNRYYIPNNIHTLPKSYDNAKKYKDNDWLDGEYIMIDRLYGGISNNDSRLVQKNGTEYKGKLYKKRRLVKGVDGNNFYSLCRVTADGRWFDNSGFPIEAPTKVEEEEEKGEIGFVHSEPTEEELAEEAKLRAEREAKMLQNLK